MEIKQLCCVGFYKSEQLKLVFRVYDSILDGKTYTIDFDIPVKKEDYKITSHPEIIVMNNVQELEFNMIAKTEGICIKERLETNIDFVKMITPIIEKQLLNNLIHINFELDKEARELLM